MRLEPMELTLAPGDTAEITILVEGVTSLAGAEVHLGYDPGPVDVIDSDPGTEGVQIAHGGFLPPDFVALNQVDNQNGSLDYAIARMPPHPPASGSGSLAVIRVKGINVGKSKLSINQVLLADPDGFPIPAQVEQGTTVITVSSNNPGVPKALLPCGAAVLIAGAAVAARGLQNIPNRVSYTKGKPRNSVQGGYCEG